MLDQPTVKMASDKPNLFSFATGELSQDAILAWLLQWADQNHAHDALHKTGRYFVERLYDKAQKPFPDFQHLEVKTQDNKIDILVRFEAKDGQKHAILIEDKVGSNEHSDQLNRYRKHLIEKEKFAAKNVLPIFLKTGFQHEWESATNKNFTVFTAKDLLDVWRHGDASGIRNDIFADFSRHLNGLAGDFNNAEHAFANFESLPVDQWTYWHWKGFFVRTKERFAVGNPYTNFSDVQARRERLLAFWFGYIPLNFMVDGKNVQCGPNFDIAISGDVPSLSIRMWIQHLTMEGIDFRPFRDRIIPKLKALNLGRPGKFKDARDSIKLMKLDLDTRDLTALQLEEYLKALQVQLQNITSLGD